MASGSTSSPCSASSRFSSARTLAMPERSSGERSAPSMTFSTTVRFSTSMKCWCTMPMPAAIAAFGSVIVDGLAADADLAAIGLVEAVDDRHQRRLAGAVLPDDAVNGAAFHPKIDGLVGSDGTETLVDADQFDRRFSHGASGLLSLF